MSRLARIVTVLAVAIGPVLLVGSPASADTNDFRIESFTADYYLDRDEGGRSTLRTVETIVAQFPEFDQNHGIYRNLVDDYQGHPTNIDVESVTDENGNGLPYETETEGPFSILQIGDGDVYVHGSTTYVITYTQHNVTLFDGATEEFYWDTNGTEWYQPFGEVTARVHIPNDLAESLNGDVACYRGAQGSLDRCDDPVLIEGDGEVVYELTERDLGGLVNVTFAIGFEEGTFVPRDNSATATPFFYAQIVTAGAAVLTGIMMLVRRRTVFADGRGRPTIVAEYLPPTNASVIEAALVTKRRKKAIAAQLISMAVSHKIRIIEKPATGFFASGSEYTLELISPEGMDADEASLARIFFGYGLTPGAQHVIKKSDTAIGEATYKLIESIRTTLAPRGWYKKVPAAARAVPALVVTLATALTFVFMVLMLVDERGGAIPFFLFLGAVIAAFITYATVARTVLTEQGAELRDHLKGLLLYITVAETDRLRMLQSPEGAMRTPVDTTDRGQMVKLYERVLPYAVLFNEEQRWAKTLGEYYDQQPPDWYSGQYAFNAAAFTAGISSISTSAASAYSASSSSSGGSSGGGSSGGGGGGGGGGGW